jgi:hypothetical protein
LRVQDLRSIEANEIPPLAFWSLDVGVHLVDRTLFLACRFSLRLLSVRILGGDMTAMFNVYGHLAMIFGIPAAALAAGAAIFRVVRGFQRNPSVNSDTPYAG